jgi:CRISPR-associated protein Cas5d
MKKSRTFLLRVQGDIACFTRPEMKVERMSYEVMTPSAGRGILEAILWKPAIVWRIEEIAVGAPFRWLAFRRNEVNSKANTSGRLYLADEDRAQRNTVALQAVDYRLKVHFEMTPAAGDEDNINKFEEMFFRRLQKGQHFAQPYLGCREFAAQVSPQIEGFGAIEQSRDLGLMFYDYAFSVDPKELPRALFFQASLKSGVLAVPSWSQVLAENGVPS